MTKSTEFSDKDKDDLKAMTHAIRKELEATRKSGIKIGKMLAQIVERRIYRVEYKTFAAYVDAVFGKSKTWAYQLMQWAECPVLSAIADNEHQARQLNDEATREAAATGMPKAAALVGILERVKQDQQEIADAEAKATRDKGTVGKAPRNAAADGLQAIRSHLDKALKIFDRVKLDLVNPDPGEQALVDAIAAWEEQQVMEDRTGKAA